MSAGVLKVPKEDVAKICAQLVKEGVQFEGSYVHDDKDTYIIEFTGGY